MMKYIALAAAITLALAPICRADCRRVTFVKHNPVVVKEVVKVVDVVQTLVTPVLPIYAPAYGAVYHPPQQAPVNDEILNAIKTLNLNVQQMNQRLSQIEGGGSRLSPMRQADEPLPRRGDGGAGDAGNAFLVLTQKHCASCHDASVAQTKGGKFSMTNQGRLAEFTPEQTGKIVESVVLRHMPKSGTMSDKERLDFLAAFAGGK